MFALFLFMSLTAQANPARVLELRQEVERLAQQVDSAQKEQQATLDVYLQRRQEVQALVLREKFRADQLKTQKARLHEALKKNRLDAAGAAKAPEWFSLVLARLEAEINRDLPLGEKANEAEKIRAALSSGKSTVEIALVQTWFMLESALKRRTTTEFMLIPLTIDNKSTPAEVVRLGELMAYGRTAEGRYGLLARQAKDWQWHEFKAKGEQEQVEKLLSQFKANQKTGLYLLPGMKDFVESVRTQGIIQ